LIAYVYLRCTSGDVKFKPPNRPDIHVAKDQSKKSIKIDANQIKCIKSYRGKPRGRLFDAWFDAVFDAGFVKISNSILEATQCFKVMT
jgi:hypothetical protein